MDLTHRHAWAAGFLDGEGCFSLLSTGSGTHETTKRACVSAPQKDRLPLDLLVEIIGGKVRKNRLSIDGTQIWQWAITNNAGIVSAIDKIYPYLVLKQNQARIVRAFADQPSMRGRILTPGVIDYRAGLIAELAETR